MSLEYTERHPSSKEEIASNMQGEVLTIAQRLAELQESLEERDPKIEDFLTNSFNRRLQQTKSLYYIEIGASLIKGEGIKGVAYAPRGWRAGVSPNRKEIQEHAKKMGYSDKLFPIDDTTIEENMMFHGFYRGNKLGYVREIGDRWVVVAGNETKYLVPVEGLKGIRLITVAPKV